MSVALSVIILVASICVLIAVHEWGHFIAARLCKARVREFAIGMGPVFYSKQKKDGEGNPVGTKFSLRVFPVGGFCDLGEDEASDDPDHFRNKKLWQKIFILAFGAVMNVVIGFFILLAMNLMMIGEPDQQPVITSIEEQSPYADKFQEGDRFYKINGHRIYNYTDFNFFSSRDADRPYDFVMLRDGEKVTLTGISRVPLPYLDESGNPRLDEEGQAIETPRFGILMAEEETVTVKSAIIQSGYLTVDCARLIWISLGDMITGNVKWSEVTGIVGIGGVVNEVVSQNQVDVRYRVIAILSIFGFVAVNLAVMNLLPVPALDGGRILFLFVSAFLLLVRKRPLSEKVEGAIHGVTMVLLLALMVLMVFKDAIQLARR